MDKAEARLTLDSELTEILISADKAYCLIEELHNGHFATIPKKAEDINLMVYYFQHYSTMFDIVQDYVFEIRTALEKLTNNNAPAQTDQS